MSAGETAPRVVAIVQARLGSVRLPGKVLAEVGGRPLLDLLVQRLQGAHSVDEVVLAVPEGEVDELLAAHAEQLGIRCVRGSEHDVLDRYRSAAVASDADVVVRITADCPLIDPALVDRVVARLVVDGLDWAVTGTSIPDGLDVEVCTRDALERTWSNAASRYDREHVFPGIKADATLRGARVEHTTDLGAMRITLDEPDDLVVIRAILDELDAATLRLADLEVLWTARPELFDANRHLARDAGAVTGTGQKLWGRALRRIPGGSMLLSKRAEMLLPGAWPSYFDRAQGCHVWDLDGERYVDVGLMGVGTNILGYAHPKVDEAVRRVVDRGALSTFNAPEEVALADRLCELHPWADMARFTRSGGEACAVAVRIARAASGKDAVAFCGYHGWHDWYLAANLAEDDALDGHLLPGLTPTGVPRALRGTSRPFAYNDLDGLAALLAAGDVGTVIMEVERSTPPEPGFLAGVRDLASRHGAVLIFDECTSGFRQALGGLHLVHGVEPDVAVFGKTLGNGFAINAVIGRAAVMEAANRTFISSTFWTERIGPTAALAALAVMAEEDAPARVHAIGQSVRASWQELLRLHGLDGHVSGIPAISSLTLPGRDPALVKTFLAARMLDVGHLFGGASYASIAHEDEVLERYLELLSPILADLAGLDDAALRDVVGPEPAWTGFGRLA
jgi:glutamate-1-semialdehyde 2,1-aminomutase